MSLRTPLSSLARHGEVFKGDPERAPVYGTPADGIWVPEVDWSSVGVPPPPDGSMASEIGPIPADGGAFLPFLKRFREIVEGEGSVESKIKRIREMCSSSASFSELAGRLHENSRRMSGDAHLRFPDNFFARELEAVPGIGSTLAARLFRAGFRSVEDLGAASDDALLAVDGLGPKALKNIREVSSQPG
jgi:hypothetical protein